LIAEVFNFLEEQIGNNSVTKVTLSRKSGFVGNEGFGYVEFVNSNICKSAKELEFEIRKSSTTFLSPISADEMRTRIMELAERTVHVSGLSKKAQECIFLSL